MFPNSDSTCAVCPTVALGGGTFWFLCLEHALAVATVGPRSAPVRPDLRGRCWGDVLECPAPAVTSTPHGGYCEAHRPGMPTPAVRVAVDRDEALPELLTAAAACMAGLGAVPIRSEPRYGDIAGSVPLRTARAHYDRTPSRAELVNPEDPRVPRAARAAALAARGWSIRLTVTTDPDSTLLRSWRGPLLVVARWESGKFAAAWLQASSDLPIRLGARQATAILKSA